MDFGLKRTFGIKVMKFNTKVHTLLLKVYVLWPETTCTFIQNYMYFDESTCRFIKVHVALRKYM